MEGVVPGTVLATLVHNRKLPEPLIGLNADQVPDIYHVGELPICTFRLVILPQTSQHSFEF